MKRKHVSVEPRGQRVARSERRDRRGLLLAWVGTALAALLGGSPIPASAEHEADHRYTITGYVLDSSREPLAGTSVSIGRGTERLGQARTDAEGFYRIQLHLHDADIGSELRLRAGEQQASITMQATVGDQSSQRIHHANFIGATFDESNLNRWQIPAWVYALAGLFVVFFMLSLLERRRRRAARARQRREAAERSSSSRPKKQGKRKRKR